jgi:hypothetical protein
VVISASSLNGVNAPYNRLDTCVWQGDIMNPSITSFFELTDKKSANGARMAVGLATYVYDGMGSIEANSAFEGCKLNESGNTPFWLERVALILNQGTPGKNAEYWFESDDDEGSSAKGFETEEGAKLFLATYSEVIEILRLEEENSLDEPRNDYSVKTIVAPFNYVDNEIRYAVFIITYVGL